MDDPKEERQITTQPVNHILTNINVWSPDAKWIVYDTRSDPAGENFDSSKIEVVHLETGEVRLIYQAQRGAHCGVATFHPKQNKVVFILGPEVPTPDWQYSSCHRQGVVVNIDRPQQAEPLDARDIVAPFTPGALRGGSHVHVFDGDGEWVSFTYEDHLLASLAHDSTATSHELNQRNVGVAVPGRPVHASTDHPRNHDGTTFSVVVTRTVDFPQPGSDEIDRAFEEGWVGSRGYRRSDGSWQRRALAFQGNVVTKDGRSISEVFVVDLPEDVTLPGDGPLTGTPRTRPRPPRGTIQRRLTFTSDRKHAGLQGPRHWLRSSPDGMRIAFLMRDDDGIVQIWTISPNGGEPKQLTTNAFDIASAFSWSPDGEWIAYVADKSVFKSDTATGEGERLTRRTDNATAPRPEACVFSPDGKFIAYVRRMTNTTSFNQVFVVTAH